MSDTEETPQVEEETKETPEGGGYVPQKVEIPQSDDPEEAKRAMQDARKRKEQQTAEDIAEYQEQRKAEKLKEADEIEQLRLKREERKKERVEEEKRLQGQRIQDDIRKKAEEEERKKKKQEEEDKRKADRERKRQEAMKRMGPKKPNYVITKKEGGGEDEDDDEKKPVQKSKEQLEQEKRAILAQRIQPLSIEDADSPKLQEKAKALHDHIRNLLSQQYDLQQQYQRLQYDMIEMAERARQMSKGKKGLSSAQVDESFDRLADKYQGAPPKVRLCSKYERQSDNRSFGEVVGMYEKITADKPMIPRVHPIATPMPMDDDDDFLY